MKLILKEAQHLPMFPMLLILKEEYHVPMLPVAPGRYSLELQLLDATGAVVERRRHPLPIRPLAEVDSGRFIEMGGYWRFG